MKRSRIFIYLFVGSCGYLISACYLGGCAYFTAFYFLGLCSASSISTSTKSSVSSRSASAGLGFSVEGAGAASVLGAVLGLSALASVSGGVWPDGWDLVSEAPSVVSLLLSAAGTGLVGSDWDSVLASSILVEGSAEGSADPVISLALSSCLAGGK